MSANVLIKSGTNEFHGSAFEYHYDEALKSRPYFLPADQKKPKTRQNQFGGTLGGPIVQNKLFFFGSYEGTDDRAGRSASARCRPRRCAAAISRRRRRRSTTRSPAPPTAPAARRFPATSSRASASIRSCRSCIADLPLPNQPGLADNYFATGDYTFARHKVDAKVNYNPTDKLRLVGPRSAG